MHTPGPDIRFPHRAARDTSPKRVRDTSHDLRIAGNTGRVQKKRRRQGQCREAGPCRRNSTSRRLCDPDAANLARTEPNYRIGDACESGPAAILCGSPSNTRAQFSGIDSPGNGYPGIVNRSRIVIAGPKRAASPETGSNQELKIARKTRTSKLATMTRTVQRTNPTKVASCAEMFIVPCSCSAIVPAPLTPECRLIGLRFAVKHLRNAGSFLRNQPSSSNRQADTPESA